MKFYNRLGNEGVLPQNNRHPHQPDDVIIGKAEIIERCLERVTRLYSNQPKNLENIDKQDAILLNIQRACQASIDLAMRIVKMKSLGIPKETREAFQLLESAGIITSALSVSLQKMVGFRNIAIHDYEKLDLKIIQSVIEKKLKDIQEFSSIGLKLE